MSNPIETVTVTLPTTRADGSAFAATDYSAAHIFKDGKQIGSITAPALTFVDPTPLTPGAYSYTATIVDTLGQESDPSVAVVATVAAQPVKPSAPTIAVTLA